MLRRKTIPYTEAHKYGYRHFTGKAPILAYNYNTLIILRFANEEALAEIRRILKPGAKIGMIWNIEDCMQLD